MKPQPFIVNGIIILIVAMVFSHAVTKSCGNNSLPTTTPEAILDLCAIVMTLVGAVLVTIGVAIKK